MHKLPGDADFN